MSNTNNTNDIIERAEAALKFDREHCGWRPYVIELLAELKTARAEIERLSVLYQPIPGFGYAPGGSDV